MSILNKSHWVTTAYGRSGYGSVTRGIFNELIKRKHDFTFENYDWDAGMRQSPNDYSESGYKKHERPQKEYMNTSMDSIIHHRTLTLSDAQPLPPEVKGKKNIFMTGYPFEPAPPPYFIKALEQYDSIITPSEYSKKILRHGVLTKHILRPIEVVPWGYDPTLFYPNESIDDKEDEPFIFSSIFQWQHLKSPYELINAYLQEFDKSDNVVLKLRAHTDGTDMSYLIMMRTIRKWSVRMWEFTNKKMPRIELIINSLDSRQMGNFYRDSDAVVHVSKAEFFGLPVLEAMACGVPVIATNWHAVGEFYDDENLAVKGYKKMSIPKEYDGTLYDRRFGIYQKVPYIAEIRQRMRTVYEMSQNLRTLKGEKMQTQSRPFTWANTVDLLEKIT